jgi:putative transcriptional regulator
MIEPKYHPGEEILLDYADGSLSEPTALVVATHLALCPWCRRQVAELEAIGGALLEDEAPEPLSPNCLIEMMARLDDGSGSGEIRPGADRLPTPRPEPAPAPADLIRIPQPLRSYLDAPLERLDWRPVMRGIEEVDLGLGRAPVRTRLLRLRPGAAVPRHGHSGLEINLVLAGGYHDQRGRYRFGDVVVDDDSVDHRPVADRGGDCVCLSVTDAPLRMTGGLRRILNIPLFRR